MTDAGCDPARITVTGTMKFDVAHRVPEKEATLRAYLDAAGFDPAAPILLGGSTWPGEDTFILGVYRKALAKRPDLRLVIVPRHFEKAGDVEIAIRTAGFPCLRKSRAPPTPHPQTQAALHQARNTRQNNGFKRQAPLPQGGQIRKHKSLYEKGGQNMIEPCLCGCATVVGPHTENFRPVMSDLLAHGALLQGSDVPDTESKLLGLFADPAALTALGQRATEAVERRRGATPRIAAAILATLSDRPPPLTL